MASIFVHILPDYFEMTMHGFILLLLAIGSLGLINGEKILYQESGSRRRQIKVKNQAKKDSSTYATTEGYHDEQRWAVFYNYAELTCNTVTASHGYPQGVCAEYTYPFGPDNSTLYWMSYVGESKIDSIRMYSFFKDKFCTLPFKDEVPSGYDSDYTPQGVESWHKGCCVDQATSFSAQAQPPNFKNGVVFNIFSAPSYCEANSIQATFNFNFIPYDQCGPFPSSSTFLKDGVDANNAPKAVGVKLMECHTEYVILEVYADLACSENKKTIFFPRTETCKSGQNCGDVTGYGNFNCV